MVAGAPAPSPKLAPPPLRRLLRLRLILRSPFRTPPATKSNISTSGSLRIGPRGRLHPLPLR
eukprot:1849366-Prymnesium_polylepis.1